jgi:hypothetical protein
VHYIKSGLNIPAKRMISNHEVWTSFSSSGIGVVTWVRLHLILGENYFSYFRALTGALLLTLLNIIFQPKRTSSSTGN